MKPDSSNRQRPDFSAPVNGNWQPAAPLSSATPEPYVSPQSYVPRGAGTDHRRLTPKVMGALMIGFGILALTYGAAATLASGAASHTTARGQYLAALQQASAEYRRARADCLRLPFAGRDACIADAHATEDRARAIAALSPPSFLASLRSRTNHAIDAGDHDSIVIEPACSVVSRGQAGVCEIQVSGNTPAQSKADIPMDQVRADLKSSDAPMVKARTSTLPGMHRNLMELRTDANTRRDGGYLFNVAAVTR